MRGFSFQQLQLSISLPLNIIVKKTTKKCRRLLIVQQNIAIVTSSYVVSVKATILIARSFQQSCLWHLKAKLHHMSTSCQLSTM
jgi:hypothetical protein